MLADATLTPEDQRECLNVQRREIQIHRFYMQRVRNSFQASFYCYAGSMPYPGLPSLPEIIDQKLTTNQRWYEYEDGVGELDSPRERLMRAHRNDPPRRMELREFPYHEYPGLDSWPRAPGWLMIQCRCDLDRRF